MKTKTCIKPIIFFFIYFIFSITITAANNKYKKLIEFGWDTLNTTQLKNQYKEMEKNAPYDGIGVKLDSAAVKEIDYFTISSEKKWEKIWFTKVINDMKSCNFEKFTDNFIRLSFVRCDQSIPSWYNDKRWKKIINNMKIVSYITKESGFKGIAMDVEAYSRKYLFKYTAESNRTFEETCRKVRERGREYIKALTSKHKNMTIFCFWAFSLNRLDAQSNNPQKTLSTATYGLYPSFLNGILDELPEQAAIIDGCEYAYRNKSRKDYLEKYHTIKSKCKTLVAPENIKKFNCQISAGFSFYLDAYLNPPKSDHYIGAAEGLSRVKTLEKNLKTALEISEKYVWTWGEQCSWWKTDFGSSWKRRQVQKTVGKGKLWEEAMPGITNAINKAKSPVKYITNIIEQKKKAETLVNIANNPDFDMEKSTRIKAEKDWLIKTAPEGWYYWQIKGDKGNFVWDKKTGKTTKGSALALNSKGGCFIQAIKVKQNTDYYISAKTKKTGTTKANIRIRWKNNKGKWAYKPFDKFLTFPESKGWQKGKAVVSVPNGAEYMVILLSVSGQNSKNDKCWFDDIEIYEID